MYNFQPINLRRGAGKGNPEDGLCLMQMVDWFSGSNKVSDRPTCTSPILGTIGILLNDYAVSQEKRNTLWPLVWKLLDSKDPSNEQIRTEFILRSIVHRIVAKIFSDCQLEFCTRAAANLYNAQTIFEIETACSFIGKYVFPENYHLDDSIFSEDNLYQKIYFLNRLMSNISEIAAGIRLHSDFENYFIPGNLGALITLLLHNSYHWDGLWDQTFQILNEAIDLGKHGEEDPVYQPRETELRKILETI
jgi:hypothetical protein